MSDKNKKNVYLVGDTKDKLSCLGLPSNQDVLQLYFHHRFVSNKSILESGKSVINDVVNLYKKFGVPVISDFNAVRKLTELRNKWTNLNKSKNRHAAKDIKNQDKFLKVLDQLFDITPKNVNILFKTEAAKAFYISQKNSLKLRPKTLNYKLEGLHHLIQ